MTPGSRRPDSEIRRFRTSSFCTTGGCVGTRITATSVDVVDTKQGGEVSLTFSHEEWTAFVAGVKNGEFDL